MTDTDQVVVWLRATLEAAQRYTEAAGGDEWRRRDHPSDSVAIYDLKGEPVVYDEGSPSEAQQAHIVRQSPAAVLRRLTADRKTLNDCTEILDDEDGYFSADTKNLAHDTLCNLAEGWGWTQGE